MSYITVTINVPEERLAEFHSVYASWLKTPADGVLPAFETAPRATIVEWWAKQTENGRALIRFLAEVPGTQYTGVEIGTALGYKGDLGRAVAGTLSHPSKVARALGYYFPVNWDTETNRYWLRPEVAKVMPL